MLREIKFRGWTGKEMRYGWGCLTDESSKCFIIIDKNDNYSEPVILMQSTGLKDKNGKSVYEGDILGNDPQGTRTGTVIFEDGRFTLQGFHDDLDRFDFRRQLEVIGNIYENPELLANQPTA